jgi:hypothetical protein
MSPTRGPRTSSTTRRPALVTWSTSTAIEAVDAQTVLIKAKLDAEGKAVNPLLVAAYVSSNYVIQKAWTETLEARAAGDATAFLADTG